MQEPTEHRPRARDIGVQVGSMPTGPLNAITDLEGVAVGHVSLIEGDGPLRVGTGPVRTGATAVLPHRGNLFQDRLRAASFILNGFGKSVGLPQVDELGCIETPILLTGTLNVWRVADAVVDYMAARNPQVHSFNPLVCECNDGELGDALGRHVRAQHVVQAIEGACGGPVEEGCVGAGVGMTGFGWKAGIGTASRIAETAAGKVTVGALVLTNTGRASDLRIAGIPVGRELDPCDELPLTDDGSIIMLVGTDAALSSRQLGRVARRAALGLGRTGATASHGSGDFSIAFSTTSRVSADGRERYVAGCPVCEPELSALFQATVEAVEEAIINSLLRARTMVGRDGVTRRQLPIDRLLQVLHKHGCQGG